MLGHMHKRAEALTRPCRLMTHFRPHAQEGRGTNQAITQGMELHQVHDLIHKGSDDLSGFPSGPQLGAEQQGLPDCGLG